jgi:hypothetical protein
MQINAGWSVLQLIPALFFIFLLISALLKLFKGKPVEGFRLLLINGMLFVQLLLVLVLPKIMMHTQGPAVNFWKTYAHKNVYIQPLGYDSYAHYFYGKVKLENRKPEAFKKYLEENKSIWSDAQNPSEARNQLFTRWLLNEKIDKPAYFVCINTKADEFEKEYRLKRLGEEGGFVFFCLNCD